LVFYLDAITQATSLTWINDFILLSRETMLPYASDLLVAILPSLAHKNASMPSFYFTALRKANHNYGW